MNPGVLFTEADDVIPDMARCARILDADWRLRQVEVYRRAAGALRLVATLLATDMLTTPLLPDFACPVERFFT